MVLDLGAGQVAALSLWYSAAARALPACPLCSAPEATVVHLLALCPGKLAWYLDWASVRFPGLLPARLPWPDLELELFKYHSVPDTCSRRLHQARAQYVGRCFTAAAATLHDDPEH